MLSRNGINATYGRTARFDNNEHLTENDLMQLAPSVFATTAHHSRSARFAPIPTIEVVRGLAKEGFVCVGAKQCIVRDESKHAFAKHLLRFRQQNAVTAYNVGGTVPEILLKNANDGSSVYDLFAGLFRIQCMNSLVALQEGISSVKVKHVGKDIVGQVIEGTYRVVDDTKLALAAPADWAQLKLEREEEQAFAEAARIARFGDAEGAVNTPITANQLLIARRTGDQANDLWTTFNRVQENVIRGGLSGIVIDPETRRRRRMTTRAVNGIDQDVKLNRALWTLANRMAELKGWQAPKAA